MNGPSQANALLTEADVAAYLSCSRTVLQHDRHASRGIRYIKLGPSKGAAVRYRLTDVEAYLNANTHETEMLP